MLSEFSVPSGLLFSNDENNSSALSGCYEDYGAFNCVDLLAMEFEENEEIISPWLNKGDICWISGGAGCLKTYFTLGICQSILNESDFGQWKVVKKDARILYVDGEMKLAAFAKRIKQLNITNSQNLFIINREKCSGVLSNSLYISEIGFQNYVKMFCVEHGIDLVIFDNISSLTNCIDENTKTGIDVVTHYFLDLRKINISVIAIQHNNKSGSMRGSSSMLDNPDVSIAINRPDMCSNEIVIRFNKYRNEQLDCVKGNIKFSMTTDDVGHVSWNDSTMINYSFQERDLHILLKLVDKISRIDIANEFGITPNYVGKIRTKYINDGLFTNDNGFTDKGLKLFDVNSIVYS
ncbi:MAG: AAA family ATPase [Desulfobulbaceae bacterium]|nr:AAA family ATPase [Desulfobulbaceae bacterium]